MIWWFKGIKWNLINGNVFSDLPILSPWLWCVSLFFPRFCWPRLPACFRRPRTMEVSAERSSVVSLAGHKLIWRMMIDRYAALLDFLWFHKDLITYIYIYIYPCVCVVLIWFYMVYKDLCGFDMGMAQKTGMDRSAVIRTYGTSELHRRPLTQTYWKGTIKWPGISTSCHFWVWIKGTVWIISLRKCMDHG